MAQTAIAAPAQVKAQSCGIASLIDLCILVGQPLSSLEAQELFRAYPDLEYSLSDIGQAAASLGINLVGVSASLEELASQVQGPKIIHLKDPAHFIVVARASVAWVQVVDRGGIRVLNRESLEQRYTGHALILEQNKETHGPRLQVDEFHYGFGIAGIGQDVEHHFKIINSGDEDLNVSLQPKGCSGPDASIQKETLRPGESTTVDVQLTIRRPGPTMVSVALVTNELMQPTAFLTVHGMVPHDLLVWPERLYVGGIKDSIAQRTVTVSGPESMELGKVSSRGGHFDVRLEDPEVGEDQRKVWRVVVSLRRDHYVGNLDDQLDIETSHRERPLVTIPVTGRIRGDLEVVPSAAFLGFVRVGEGKTIQMITIRSRSGAVFKVESAASDSPDIGVTCSRGRVGEWIVSIEMTHQQPRVIDGTVTITTDVLGEETLRIPVYTQARDA